MDDKETSLKKVETGIEDAARAVEHFANKVAPLKSRRLDFGPKMCLRRILVLERTASTK
jgi:hypothetical protein